MKKRLLLALGLAAAALSLPAAAQLDSSAVYIGGSLGNSHFTDVCTNQTGCDDRDTSWGLFTGLQFSRYMGAEIGYRDFGHATVGGTGYWGSAFEGDLVVNYPLRGSFGLLGRIGAFNAKVSGGGNESKKYGVTYGLGVFYDVTPTFGFRVEWQRYAKATDEDVLGVDTHLDMISLGAVIRFR